MLALVADALAVAFGCAVTRDVADFAAVVALLTLCAVTSHVAVSTARVAGLLATAEATVTTAVATALRAVASNVSDLTALVAFLTATSTARESTAGEATVVTAGRACLLAVAGDVAGLTASVAGLFLGGLGAFTAHVSLATAVVASRCAFLGAVTGLVRRLATVKAATASRLVLHYVEVS